MKKIMIIGSGGAGKSTLARKLGKILGIEVIHLDALFWKPGWVDTPREEWADLLQQISSNDCWIIDGNYGGTMDIRIQRADTIIFLDLPRTICLARVIQRRIKYAGRSRPDMGAGCPEKLDLPFLKWIWRYPIERKPGILEKLGELTGEKQIIHFMSQKDVDDFIRHCHTAEFSHRP